MKTSLGNVRIFGASCGSIEISVPVESVIGALWDFTNHRAITYNENSKKVWCIPNFWANNDGVIFTMNRAEPTPPMTEVEYNNPKEDDIAALEIVSALADMARDFEHNRHTNRESAYHQLISKLQLTGQYVARNL